MIYEPYLGMNILVSEAATPLFYLMAAFVLLHVLYILLSFGVFIHRYRRIRGDNHA